MYEELVKRLRNRRICIQQLGTLNDYPLLGEAADAIEELSRTKDECDACGDKTQSVIESLQKKIPRWIPVTERLPEKNGSYLVYVYGEVTEMNCWHGKWHRLGDDYTKAVTHWMPLPEPPKEET